MKSKPSIVLTPNERSSLFALVTLAFFLSYLIANTFFLVDSYDELKEDAEDLIYVVDTIHQQGLVFSQTLATMPYQNCDVDHIKYIQELMVQKPLILAVRYYGDGYQCSTRYLDDFKLGVQKFRTGDGEVVSFFPAKSTDQLYDSYAVRYGDYELIYSTMIAESFIELDYRFEIVYLRSLQPLHVAGSPGLFNENVKTGLNWIGNENHVAYSCSNSSALCIAIELPQTVVDENFWQNFVISIFIALITSWFASNRTRYFYYRKRALSTRVANGLKNKSFYFYYQPIVRLSDQAVIGCEVLARFKDKYGEIYPDQFIPLLPQKNLTWLFTEHLIESTLMRFNAIDSLDKNFRISVNVFPQDISNNNIAAIPEMPLFKAYSSQFAIEITEDQYLDESHAQGHLYNLSQHDIAVAIDDFGTGYSNLQQIQSAYCNVLKIDRSFVMDFEDGAIRSSLIPNIVEIAKKAELKLVAEGIENPQQYLALKELNIEYGQGWLFGKPVSFEQFKKQFIS